MYRLFSFCLRLLTLITFIKINYVDVFLPTSNNMILVLTSIQYYVLINMSY